MSDPTQITLTPISLVIPSLNSPIIDQVITQVLKQAHSELISEIVVVGKDELNLMPSHPSVRLIDTQTAVSAPVARNIGIQETTGEWLIFLDSDCIPQPNWLDQHHRMIIDNLYDVICGGVVPAGQNYWHLVYNLTLFHEVYTTTAAGSRHYFPTLNLAVRRSVIDDVGGLDETLIRGQDVEWTLRMTKAGYKLHLAPSAAVFHKHSRRDFAAVWRDCARSGFHMRRVRLENQEAFSTPFFLRSATLVLLLAPIIAAGVTANIIRKHLALFREKVWTIPGIYLTKIAWCWGASRRHMP